MSISFDFTNHTVVVTGATRGIGKAIANQYESAGANLLLTGTDPSKISRLNEECLEAERRVQYAQVDFRDSDSLERFLETLKKLPRLDVLVNNAGINRLSPVTEVNAGDYDDILAVNLHAPFKCCQTAAQLMCAAGYGRILNIASIWSVVTKSGRSVYTMTKTGILGLTRALAVECAPHGVLVNTLSPGFANTELTRSTLSESEINALSDQVPAGRFASTDELAVAALFLTSDANSYMTGQNITIDGGFTIV